MSTVVPKLLYSPTKVQDIPVWEITTEGGNKIYYERFHYRGLRPIGVKETFRLSNSSLSVCDTVKTSGGHMPPVLRAKAGYVAPMSWYEPDPQYKGLHPPVLLKDLEPKRQKSTQAKHNEDGHFSGDEYDSWDEHSGNYYSDGE